MPHSANREMLAAGIRPTRQRAALLAVLRGGGLRHLTAEQMYREACDSGLRLSLATVYNTLNLFAQNGLLRRVDVGERTLFCTNPAEHHHLYDESSGALSDIPPEHLSLAGLPPLPEGATLVRTDVIVRVRRSKF